MGFVIKNVDNNQFLTQFLDKWEWCELLVDQEPDIAPYIFSDMHEALEILNKFASEGNCIVKEIAL